MKINALLAAGMLAAVASSFGADDSKNAGKTSSDLSAPDEKFVMKAAQGGMTEVKLGELAQQKGKRDEVKKFGERMVTDHSKANEELKSLAFKKGLTLPEQLDITHAGAVDRMSKLEGSQFDKAYVDDMIEDHKKDVSEFEAASKTVSDTELKAFIAKTLPTLKAHLGHIKEIESGKGK